MSLYKRGRIWWCEWEVGGERVRESTYTSDRKAAQEFHDRRRADIWRETRLGETRVATWDEAALAVAMEMAPADVKARAIKALAQIKGQQGEGRSE